MRAPIRDKRQLEMKRYSAADKDALQMVAAHAGKRRCSRYSGDEVADFEPESQQRKPGLEVQSATYLKSPSIAGD